MGWRGGWYKSSIGVGGWKRKVLLLSGSQAAIAAIKKAGCTGRSRTRDLRNVVRQIAQRQRTLGPEAVRFGWIKAHIGIHGNEKADEQAKLGTQEPYLNSPYITEGALSKHGRRGERRSGGYQARDG